MRISVAQRREQVQERANAYNFFLKIKKLFPQLYKFRHLREPIDTLLLMITFNGDYVDLKQADQHGRRIWAKVARQM